MVCLAGRRSPKKLTDAARWWAQGRADAGSASRRESEGRRVDEQLQALGVSAALPDWMKPSPGRQVDPEERFRVWPDNWDTLDAFLRCRTQWVYHFSGAVRGLDYAGVDTLLRRLKLADADAVFADIQAMELAALEVFDEQWQQSQSK